MAELNQATPEEPVPGVRIAGVRSSRARRSLVSLGVGILLAGVLAAVLFSGVLGPVTKGSTPGNLVVEPAGIDAATVELLSLDTLGGETKEAPNVHLVDGNGTGVSLSQFRGKSVVLSFIDDRCTDVCTLFAQDVVTADRDLGSRGRSHVVFLSVNANPFYSQSRYVASWSRQNELSRLSNWYFVTSSASSLKHVWGLYGEGVQPDYRNRTVVHDPLSVFIDPRGRIRGIAEFGASAIDAAPFAHGLARFAVDLLPPSRRSKVAGPQADSSASASANPGDSAPAFSLQLLGATGRLSLDAYRGKPLVINFWASTCSYCVSELAGLAAASREAGAKVNFLGVDVDDVDPANAVHLAVEAGIGYPIVADSSGAVANNYHLDGLPWTVIVGPGGKILARHPGVLSTEQLIYVLAVDFPRAGLSGG